MVLVVAMSQVHQLFFESIAAMKQMKAPEPELCFLREVSRSPEANHPIISDLGSYLGADGQNKPWIHSFGERQNEHSRDQLRNNDLLDDCVEHDARELADLSNCEK